MYGTLEHMLSALTHRGMHRIVIQLGWRHLTHLPRFGARRRFTTLGPGSEHERALLTDFSVARVQHHVARVGLHADEALDRALDAGLFEHLSDGGFRDRLVDLHRAARHRPVLLVGPSDQQQIASIIQHTTLTDGTSLVASGASGSFR